jgi:hypothetical protein
MAVIMLAFGISAQDQGETPEKYLSHGEFAVLLLKVVAFQDEIPDPPQALERVQRLELVPLDWALDELLTHGEFSDVLHTFGVMYVANNRDDLASRRFVEAMLRRELWKLRDYLVAREGGGRDIIVSESEF